MREKTAYRTGPGLSQGGRYRSNPCTHPLRMVSVLGQGTWYRSRTNVLDPPPLSARQVWELYRRRWRSADAVALTTRVLDLAYWWTGSPHAVQLQIYATLLFHALRLTICQQGAEAVGEPVERISVAMVFRAFYPYSHAAPWGAVDDLVLLLTEQASLPWASSNVGASLSGSASSWNISLGEILKLRPVITPPASAANPCGKVSLRTAPQRDVLWHRHPGGRVICTLAPPPSGSSRHRSLARARLLQRSWARSPPDHRPHVRIAASVPRRVRCWGHPAHMSSPVEPGASLRTTGGDAVPQLRLSRQAGLHASPGCSGGLWGEGSAAQPVSWPLWPQPIRRGGLAPITTRQTWSCLPVRIQRGAPGFPVGFCVIVFDPRFADGGSGAPAGDRLAPPHPRGRHCTGPEMALSTLVRAQLPLPQRVGETPVSGKRIAPAVGG
jgi:hypothetical protein